MRHQCLPGFIAICLLVSVSSSLMYAQANLPSDLSARLDSLIHVTAKTDANEIEVSIQPDGTVNVWGVWVPATMQHRDLFHQTKYRIDADPALANILASEIQEKLKTSGLGTRLLVVITEQKQRGSERKLFSSKRSQVQVFSRQSLLAEAQTPSISGMGAASLPARVGVENSQQPTAPYVAAVSQPQQQQALDDWTWEHPTPATLLAVVSSITVKDGFGRAIRVDYAMNNGQTCSTDRPEQMIPPSRYGLGLTTITLEDGGTMFVESGRLRYNGVGGKSFVIMRDTFIGRGTGQWYDGNHRRVPPGDKSFDAQTEILLKVLALRSQQEVENLLALRKKQHDDGVQLEARKKELVAAAVAQLKQKGVNGLQTYLPDAPALFAAVQTEVTKSFPVQVETITYTGYYLSQCFSHQVSIIVQCGGSALCTATPSQNAVSARTCDVPVAGESSGLTSVDLKLKDGDLIDLESQIYRYQPKGGPDHLATRDYDPKQEKLTGPWLGKDKQPLDASDPLVKLGTSVREIISRMAPLSVDALIALDGPEFRQQLEVAQRQIEREQEEAKEKQEAVESERRWQQTLRQIASSLSTTKHAGDHVCSREGDDLGYVERVADGRVQVRQHVHEQGYSSPGLIINGIGTTGTSTPSRDYDEFHWYDAHQVGLCQW